MKIIQQLLKRFKDLECGEVFRVCVNGDLYIKTSANPLNTVRLRDGMSMTTQDSTEVIQVSGHFVETNKDIK